ncbi:MAG: phage holin family protein [Acidimicrobiales bacterium]|nr:phage holin family protein [Acidimicrobiales bacterium]RZV47773.1 MAG: phage holin family protein [Acidimicrobiales bacterium]
MIRLALRLGVNAVALWVASRLIDGVDLSEEWQSVLFVALIFGLINAVIKPIAKLLTFPITMVTLGLFTLIVNAAMLWLTSAITSSLDVDGFVPAVLGALVVSLVSWVLSVFVPDDD